MSRLRPARRSPFDFEEGAVLVDKYQVVGFLGSGWEGAVYRVRELDTGIERAAKFFFPKRNLRNRATRFYARKLNKLRHCHILIQYHTQECVWHDDERVTFLVSEYVEGELLSRFLKRQRGGRLAVFEGLHLLHTLAAGVEQIHGSHEYHGDLHEDNIIIRRRGIDFDVKLVDMFNWGTVRAENIRDDVCDLVRVFYEALGGRRFYSRQRREVKEICCGLKRTLIARKFRTAGHLRQHLESMEWDG